MTGRVAVIGDLAGQLDELVDERARLGADDQGRLPDDLTVVQVGDLVHRGPDSDGVVSLVDGYLREQPSRWVQLIGNHEAQYVHAPAFDWPEHIGDAASDTLRRWWADGSMVSAAAVRAGDEQFLVTHAGLTVGYWQRVLDGQRDATLCARALNSFVHGHQAVLFAAGAMLGGGGPNPEAGPVWAADADELLPGWVGEGALPFSQVHGHSSIYDWRRRRYRFPLVAERSDPRLDERAAHVTVALPGGRLVGVDPGHGAAPHTPWQALVLDDAEVVEPARSPVVYRGQSM